MKPVEGLSPVSPPPGAHPVFFYTDRARERMREKNQFGAAVSLLPSIPPTPEQLDYEERLDRAVLRLSQLLEQTETLLQNLHLAPEHVSISPSEQAELRNITNWTKAYRNANEMNSIWLDEGVEEEVLDLIALDESLPYSDDVLADVEEILLLVPTERRLLQPPAEMSAWLSGSWNFREYRDADFEAEQRAMQRAYLGTPRSARASTFGATEFIPRQASSHVTSNSLPDAHALMPSIKRMYASAQESLTRSSSPSPSRWRDLMKLDTKMRWRLGSP